MSYTRIPHGQFKELARQVQSGGLWGEAVEITGRVVRRDGPPGANHQFALYSVDRTGPEGGVLLLGTGFPEYAMQGIDGDGMLATVRGRLGLASRGPDDGLAAIGADSVLPNPRRATSDLDELLHGGLPARDGSPQPRTLARMSDERLR